MLGPTQALKLELLDRLQESEEHLPDALTIMTIMSVSISFIAPNPIMVRFISLGKTRSLRRPQPPLPASWPRGPAPAGHALSMVQLKPQD